MFEHELKRRNGEKEKKKRASQNISLQMVDNQGNRCRTPKCPSFFQGRNSKLLIYPNNSK